MAEEEVKPHIVAFTQAGCPPCEMLKMYCQEKSPDVVFIEVETDIDRELLQTIYPGIIESGFPYATINGEPIGDLMYYLESGL